MSEQGIANLNSVPPKGIEVKSYESGIVYKTEYILAEIEMDKALTQLREPWAIDWVFIGCRPSAPLETELRNAGITIILR